MAPLYKSLALAGAFFALSGFAAPVEKRAVVWETVTKVDWTTIEVTTTVYPDQPTATPAVAAVTTTPAVVQSEPAPSEAAPSEPAQTLVQVQEKQKQPAPAPAPTTQPAPVPAPAPTEESTSSAAPEPAPEPSPDTSVPVEPSTTSSPAPAETTTAAAGGGGGSSGYTGSCSEGSPCTGQVTFYDTATQQTAPSSCGFVNDGESELVLALPHGIMTDGDCGKSVKISYKGTSKVAKVVDKCMGCDNTSIDLSRALFKVFASLGEGRLSGVEWFIM